MDYANIGVRGLLCKVVLEHMRRERVPDVDIGFKEDVWLHTSASAPCEDICPSSHCPGREGRPAGASAVGSRHGDGDKGALRVGDNEGGQLKGGGEQMVMKTKVEVEVEVEKVGDGGMQQSLEA